MSNRLPGNPAFTKFIYSLILLIFKIPNISPILFSFEDLAISLKILYLSIEMLTLRLYHWGWGDIVAKS